jgi:predicted nuclease of predicted toxin-antitoxin system
VTVIEVARGADDVVVLEMATRERRIFLTEDRDFGQLVYATARPAPGVVLLRFPSSARANLPAWVVDVVARHGEKLEKHFVVLQPGVVRFAGGPRE